MGGIAVDRARVTDRGFFPDRRWMLVGPDQVFMTQRDWPSMALIRLELLPGVLRVTSVLHPDPLMIPFGNVYGEPANARLLRPETADVRVWDDVVPAQFVSADADAWFTLALDTPCRLVYMPDEAARITDPKYVPGGGLTSFSDAFPFLLIGQASLDELNGRLETPVPMNRFRPNIVFTGGAPFQEDSLGTFTIRGIRFRAVKPCARCVITTIDQQTAAQGKEPLRTLAGFRAQGNNVLFGQNLAHEGVGEVSVGDELVPMGIPSADH
jgi:uncharacterized protein YcbX